MKRGTIILIVISLILVIALMNGCSSYNSMVSQEEAVKAQWAKVEAAYQARLDKTGNLFEIVSSASDFEKSTLTGVVEARAKATNVQINVDDLTPENMKRFQEAQAGFSTALGRLMAVAENYPTLQSVAAWRDFQAQYEGMENRINTERNRFNEAVQEYNVSVRRFPRNIWAGIFGFKTKASFEAEAGAEKAPSIKDMKKDK